MFVAGQVLTFRAWLDATMMGLTVVMFSLWWIKTRRMEKAIFRYLVVRLTFPISHAIDKWNDRLPDCLRAKAGGLHRPQDGIATQGLTEPVLARRHVSCRLGLVRCLYPQHAGGQLWRLEPIHHESMYVGASWLTCLIAHVPHQDVQRSQT